MFVVALAAGCEVLVGDETRTLRPELSADAGSDVDQDVTAPSDAGTDSSDDALARTTTLVETLATGQASPRSIVLDERSAYWANLTSSTVGVFDKTTRVASTFAIAPARPLRWVTADATQVFWSVDTQGGCVDGLQKKAKDNDAGSDAGVVAVAACSDSMSRVNGMGLDGTYLYWTTHPSFQSLFAVPKEGGNVVTLASGLGGQPDALAVAADAVCWLNPPNQTIARWDKSTQAVTLLVEGQKGLSAIATDGAYVYFANLVDVLRVPSTASVDAGTPVETVASAQNGPAALALFQDQIYWVNAGDGTVMRAPKAGGAPETLASGQTGVRSIAVDATGVYFTRDTGEVMRWTKQ